jgi:NosR/NirI family transcriptional regulator, nitrous oxide reductase regulator
MSNKYEKQTRYSRYDNQRRYIHKKNKRGPSALVIISSILMISTIVLSFALFNKNQNKDIDDNIIIPTPSATPQPTVDNRMAEMTSLVQQLINQSVDGVLTPEIKSSLEEQGISSESLDLLEATIQDIPEESQYSDGSYTGVGDGDSGQITVEVIIDNGKILYVTVIEHDEKNSSELKEVFRSFPIAILTNQSTQDIDAISGATLISDGFIQAVEDALSKASNQ